MALTIALIPFRKDPAVEEKMSYARRVFVGLDVTRKACTFHGD
jgi:hypothetical protein